ncbi:endo alpha-1,4 polygalactosaminidase [Pseudomonas sp. M30-35]|uniref:endo alpha-1,4 polygalactosaminidase n=1 Tax=Pseudomonas sp. M30-35 TaxID=1981174 RepID=UPI0026AEEE44
MIRFCCIRSAVILTVSFFSSLLRSTLTLISQLRHLLMCFCLLLSGVTSAQQPAPKSVAFWYAASPPLAELAQFDWSVVEPVHLSHDDVNYLRAQGSQPFAYLSVGEFDGDLKQLQNQSLQAGASPTRNDAWQSQVMRLSSDVWRNHLLQRAKALKAQGYSGLFLDTLDSFQLLPKDQQEAERVALRDFLKQLAKQEPDLKLFFNRGFEVLPELPGVAAAVAVESIHAGWNPSRRSYREVPASDREWLEDHLKPLREQGIPLVAIDYLPAERRVEARELAKQLQREGFIPFVTMPDLNYLGISSIEVKPRRIALIYDLREGALYQSTGFNVLGGLLEYLGYRVDYFAADELPDIPAAGLYAGVITWMNTGSPVQASVFNKWIAQRLDEQVPLALFQGLPISDPQLLQRLGLQSSTVDLSKNAELVSYDKTLLGSFEGPVKMRTREFTAVTALANGPTPALTVSDNGELYTPVALGDWGGVALSPFVLEATPDQKRWIVDPFVFLQRTLKLEPMPRPDVTTENGRRVATVHIDGDGFVSRAEVPGSPYAGEEVLQSFIKPHDFLTSVSVIEGEVGPKGMYPHLSAELEPIARKIFAEDKVEVATHTFSHPFFWRPDDALKGEGFDPEYGLMMKIPGYKEIDFKREINGSTDYINQRLTTPQKPVKMVFWSGDAIPDAATIKLAYDKGLTNVNGGNTALTNAFPSLTNLYPLIKPSAGGIQYYAPVINENVYTNLWHGPYYGFRDVMQTFALTDKPRRLRGLHLYYHFYSGTKQASIKVMGEIYRSMHAEHPMSLWMSDYIPRMHGLYQTSMAQLSDGSWQFRGLDKLRTVRIEPAMGWPDLSRSKGVAGVRDLPQGRYVHFSTEFPVLALRKTRDPRPALEEANIPLTGWEYQDDKTVRVSFSGQFPLQFSVRANSACTLEVAGKRYVAKAVKGLWQFKIDKAQVNDVQLTCR